ncbi:MAG: sugar ABC transporter ATP-binding protein [Lachnospiraceae bacterium]|nr:sugar ABC transporter ATP-binding protein [Lachnospiraceae bacterium]
MRRETFRMERVTYIEQGIPQIEDFNLQIYEGEIMGLLLINAYGIQAFLKLLQVNLPLYDGYVYYGGTMVNSWRIFGKSHNRISIIQTQSSLAEGLKVSENIFVMRHGFRQRIIRPALLKRQLEPFFKDIDIDISADMYVENLTVFERIVVEILRAVILGHRMIVLCEVSTMISGSELEKLHEIIRHYAGQGISFLYISLHYEEILQICDRVSLFAHGRIQKITRYSEMEEDSRRFYSEEMFQMVRGHLEQLQNISENRKIVLSFEDVSFESLDHLTFDIFEGECLTIQSLSEKVFQKFIDFLEEKIPLEEGAVCMEGCPIRFQCNKDIAILREQPTKTMIFPELNNMDNLWFGLSRRVSHVWNSRKIRNSIRQEYGKELGEDFFSLYPDQLSERQKCRLIYTRILLQRPKVVFCIQPFKGSDLPHRMFIWKMLRMLLDKGIAVIILAVNLADSMSLSERLLRIGPSGVEEEINRSAFGSLPATVPWKYLYQEEIL